MKHTPEAPRSVPVQPAAELKAERTLDAAALTERIADERDVVTLETQRRLQDLRQSLTPAQLQRIQALEAQTA